MSDRIVVIADGTVATAEERGVMSDAVVLCWMELSDNR